MIADALHALIEATLASSAAIFFVLLMRQPARRVLGAQAAYWLWLIVPVAALATLLPARSVPAQAMATLAPVSKVLPDIAIIQTAAGGDFSSLWFALWMLGALLTFTWLWRQQHGFLRSLGALRAEPDGTLRAEQARAPVVVGAWRPRLVLPSDFEQRYNADERELVLAHERAHLRRGDALANALAAIVQCLFWFNPLLHWALGRYRFDQELACDAQVLADAPQARRIYAQAMLKTQLALDAAWRLPAGCHWQPRHPLKERIAMLKQPVPRRARRMIGAMIAVLLALVGGYTAWAAQPANKTAAADVELLDVNIKLTPANGTPSTPRVLTKAGTPFSFRVGESPDDANALVGEFVARRGDNGLIDLVAKVTQAGDTLANFTFDDVQDGKPVTMTVNGKDGSPAFNLEVKIQRADPSSLPLEFKKVTHSGSNAKYVTFTATQLDQRAAGLEMARLTGMQIEHLAVVNGTSARLAPAALQGSLKSSYKDVINLTGIWLPVAPKKDDC